MNTKTTNGAEHFHAVKFYDTRESLYRIVAEYLGEGVMTRSPVLAIVTPEHRAGILAELRARHFAVDGMLAAGDLLFLDAVETLATFMVDGMPNSDLFVANISRAIQQVSRGRTDCTIRAYGEMVDVLWKSGQEAAAIRLEMYWNKLVTSHKFWLLCAYAMGSFYKDAGLADIHHQHSHVVTDQGFAATAKMTTIS